MTIEEKRNKIEEYCFKQDSCEECVLNEFTIKNKTGCYSSGENDEVIEKNYNYLNTESITEITKQLEEGVLKFYYCESEDDYFLGQRVDNFYYARFDINAKQFTWCMSRYLPWGEHVINEMTLWKEHTYPSEPKEISFHEWLMGFIRKYGVYLT